MLLIVAHHYVMNSGISELMLDNQLAFKSIFFYLSGAWGKTAINCFVMITGYFMCTSRITLKKFIKLIFQIEFYNKQYERDSKNLLEIKKDPKAIEKIARERYFMKADDEDIFVLSTDEQAEKNTNEDDETIE